MPLWGSGREGSEKKPTYLNTAEQQVTYATPKGWTQPSQGNGNALADREVLVAIGGLSLAQATEKTGIAAATISSVNWNISTFSKAATGNLLTVTVNYNEVVTVAVSNPTIVVTNGNEGSGSGRGPYTLTYASGTATNRLTFTWPIAAGHGSTNVGDILTVGAQSVVLASSSTISDVDGVVGAQGLVITAAQGTGAGTITVVA
jgi:hypothetical protein